MVNYRNTPKIIDDYGYAILLKIKTSTVTPTQNSSNLKIQLLDFLQNWRQSRTFTKLPNPRLEFKLEVGSSLNGEDISDKFF